jgi:hypothetical protein
VGVLTCGGCEGERRIRRSTRARGLVPASGFCRQRGLQQGRRRAGVQVCDARAAAAAAHAGGGGLLYGAQARGTPEDAAAWPAGALAMADWAPMGSAWAAAGPVAGGRRLGRAFGLGPVR